MESSFAEIQIASYSFRIHLPRSRPRLGIEWCADEMQ